MMIRFIAASLIAAGTASAAEASVCRNTYADHISQAETGGCGWTERCRARNPMSTAASCFQMTRAALQDVGLKDRRGRWLPNAYGITSDAEFADHYQAQTYALQKFTANNWARINPQVRGLIGSEVAGVRVTEGGLLSTAHFLGPGGLNEFAGCGFRPDCISGSAAAANGGRQRTYEIAMNRLSGGGGSDVSPITGFHTPGSGVFTGIGARQPQAPASAFLPWTAREPEQPPLQGERRDLLGGQR